MLYVCDISRDFTDRKRSWCIAQQQRPKEEAADEAKDARQRQQAQRWYAISLPAWNALVSAGGPPERTSEGTWAGIRLGEGASSKLARAPKAPSWLLFVCRCTTCGASLQLNARKACTGTEEALRVIFCPRNGTHDTCSHRCRFNQLPNVETLSWKARLVFERIELYFFF